eukprot:368857-Pelagomonas_calceolata.AAC.9
MRDASRRPFHHGTCMRALLTYKRAEGQESTNIAQPAALLHLQLGSLLLAAHQSSALLLRHAHSRLLVLLQLLVQALQLTVCLPLLRCQQLFMNSEQPKHTSQRSTGCKLRVLQGRCKT